MNSFHENYSFDRNFYLFLDVASPNNYFFFAESKRIVVGETLLLPTPTILLQ